MRYNQANIGVNNGYYTKEELYPRILQTITERQKWIKLFHSAETYIDKLKAIRLYYTMNEERIIKHHKRNSSGWYVSYIVDWTQLFSPIEQDAWNSIRAKGKIVLYPQYPVLGYFLDFGNPYLKIGLELDGKNYHNKEKDKRRDKELKQLGWTIYRITGSEMVKNDFKDFYDFEDWQWNEDPADCWQSIQNWIFNSGDGIIEAIKTVYFDRPPEGEFEHQFFNICSETLINHSLQ